MSKITFTAIGTYWEVDLYSVGSNTSISQVVTDRIFEFEKTYSRFRNDSFLSIISSTPGTYSLPTDSKKLLDLYFKLNKITEGKFTPLIGSVLEDAGYDAKYSFQPKTLKKIPTLTSVIDYDYPEITTKEVIHLDLGAAGKGYIIDIIGEVLRSHNILDFTINAGGDILHKSSFKELKIGLENPLNTNQVIGIANIKNTSICGSAGNRRKWADFHHIFDPISLKSPSNVIATWVVCPDTSLADALATCLFLVNPSVLTKDFIFEYLILFEDMSISKSSKFPGELF